MHGILTLTDGTTVTVVAMAGVGLLVRASDSEFNRIVYQHDVQDCERFYAIWAALGGTTLKWQSDGTRLIDDGTT